MPTFHGQTVDIWENLQDGTYESGITAINPNGLLIPGSTVAEYEAVPNMQMDASRFTAEATLHLALTPVDTWSFGFWYRTGNVYGTFGDPPWTMMIAVKGYLYGSVFRLIDRKSNSNGFREFYSVDGLGSVGNNVITDNTWYWVTGKYRKTGNCVWRVYDTTHAQVGLEDSFLNANVYSSDGCDFCDILSVAASSYYMHDFVVDYSYAAYPILGWAGGGGGGGSTKLAKFRKV